MKLIQPMVWKDEVCCVLLSLFVFLTCMDLLVYGHNLIEMATTVTTMTPSAALMLFPTDSDDLETGNDNGTPLPTSDNEDNSLGYTGRVHLSNLLLPLSYFHMSFPTCTFSCLTISDATNIEH